VEPAAVLEPGLQGVVSGWLGMRASFEVTEVDEAAGTWSWEVAAGPARMRLAHTIGNGSTTLTVEGPAVVVLPYLPLARLALHRLVTI
jgi:hypothetical protein